MKVTVALERRAKYPQRLVRPDRFVNEGDSSVANVEMCKSVILRETRC